MWLWCDTQIRAAALKAAEMDRDSSLMNNQVLARVHGVWPGAVSQVLKEFRAANGNAKLAVAS